MSMVVAVSVSVSVSGAVFFKDLVLLFYGVCMSVHERTVIFTNLRIAS